jgi:phenylalanyl-tRNA synthetase beta subunit
MSYEQKTESQMPDLLIANPLKTDSQTERTTLKPGIAKAFTASDNHKEIGEIE